MAPAVPVLLPAGESREPAKGMPKVTKATPIPSTKPILSMRETIEAFVPDDQEVLLGGFAYSDPFAVSHELIRQRRRGLRIIKGSGGVLVDQLIGAGCVSQLVFCHVWNSVGPEPAHCFRRAIEHGRPSTIQIDEMSYGAFTTSLIAGACDFAFMPTTPLAGAGHYLNRGFLGEKFAVIESPFDGSPVTVVSALKPRLGIFHVQQADALGNGRLYGPVAETRYAAAACDRVILVAEELVDTAVIRERPELTAIPGFMVDAIVVEPWAAHPTDSSGYYWRDLEHHGLYAEMSKTEEGFADYISEWVVGTRDHAGFRSKLGDERMKSIMARSDPWW
jgi:glutaconate CoA-transferase subunit A